MRHHKKELLYDEIHLSYKTNCEYYSYIPHEVNLFSVAIFTSFRLCLPGPLEDWSTFLLDPKKSRFRSVPSSSEPAVTLYSDQRLWHGFQLARGNLSNIGASHLECLFTDLSGPSSNS